jgi:hypothetical protein
MREGNSQTMDELIERLEGTMQRIEGILVRL